MADTSDILLFGSNGYALDADSWGPGTVRGPDKIAQRVIYATLTPQGSVPGRPDDGSPFLALARDFRSEFDVFVAWAASEAAITTSVRAAELTTDPDDAKLGYARLERVTVVADVVTLTLRVVAADESVPSTPVEFDLPI